MSNSGDGTMYHIGKINQNAYLEIVTNHVPSNFDSGGQLFFNRTMSLNLVSIT